MMFYPASGIRFLSKFILATIILFGVSAFITDAEAASVINYQGTLKSSSQSLVPDTSYTFVFKLYTQSSGGSAVWTETQTLSTQQGVFSANLGSVSAFPSGLFSSNPTLYLGITVNADSEMTPRQRVGSSPYAFTADELAFSGMRAAAQTNTLDNLNFAQTWNWSTLASGSGLSLGITNAAASDNTTLNITSASTGTNAMVFRVNDDGTYTDSTPFVIAKDGNVGVGTASPSGLFSVGSSSQFQVNSSGAITSGGGFTMSKTTSTTSTTHSGYIAHTVTPPSAPNATYTALNGVLMYNSPYYNSGQVTGIRATGQLSGDGKANQTQGIYAEAIYSGNDAATGGPNASLYAGRFSSSNSGTGYMGHIIGIKIDKNTNNGAVDLSAGLYVQNQATAGTGTTGATTAIHIEGTGSGNAISFSGNGGAAPNAKIYSSSANQLQIEASSGLVLNSGGGSIGIGTAAPTHTLTLASGNTGLVSYNTADQTTNYERVRFYWLANRFKITTDSGGSGLYRSLSLGVQGSNQLLMNDTSMSIGGGTASNVGAPIVAVDYDSVASSGTASLLGIISTVNQTSTAGYRGLWISPYEQSTGSGNKFLIDAGTNSATDAGGTHSSRFVVTNAGAVNIAQRLGVGPGVTMTGVPNSTLQISSSNYTTSANFSTAGFGFNQETATFTSTTSTGTVATTGVSTIAAPTLAASNATTITNASTFYIAGAPNAGSNMSITNPLALHIAAGNAAFGGSVGIQTTAPAYKLHVGDGSTSGIIARFQNSTGTCDINPTSTALSCSSDETLKENIVSISESSLDKIKQLNPVTYSWKNDGNHTTQTGFIAQQVRNVLPSLVSEDKNTSLLSLNYLGFIPYIIKSIQEVAHRIDGFAERFTTKELCIGSTCITEAQLIKILEQQNIQQSSTVVPPPVENQPENPEPTPESETPEETEQTPQDGEAPEPASENTQPAEENPAPEGIAS